MNEQVTLQINLSPNDYKYVKYILPHQLKILANQCNEVLLVIDCKQSKGVQFGNNQQFLIFKKQLLELIKKLRNSYNNLVFMEVNYSKFIKKKVGYYFFKKKFIPDKDFRGGPFYAYFFGLYMASNNFVFHLDSDIMLGGGNIKWINEAKKILKTNKSILCCNPLPGVPIQEGQEILQNYIKKEVNKEIGMGFYFQHFTTRLFILNRENLKQKLKYSLAPGIRNKLKGIVNRNPIFAFPEHIISIYMRQNNLYRFDFMGSKPGLWSIHPTFRHEKFFSALQKIIKNIESLNYPEAQKGQYDLVKDFLYYD